MQLIVVIILFVLYDTHIRSVPFISIALDRFLRGAGFDFIFYFRAVERWDGDVSEKGFSFKNGVAINPEVKKVEDYSTTDRARFEKMDEKERLEEVYKFEKPFPEVNVTPQVRQEGFEAFVTTDDHLMHLTGIAKDQNGTKYYITKNSWGTERNTFGGYLNMSDSFVRAKTIYIMVHKDAIPKAIKSKLGI